MFGSDASDLVPGDVNGAYDVFVRDLDAGTTELASLTSSGAQIAGGAGNGTGSAWAFDTAQISRDGRYVAFSSSSAGIVPGDTNGTYDGFVRDRIAGTTTRVSVDSSGAELAGASGAVQMSADGTRFLFAHRPIGAAESDLDWYLHDRATGSTRLASMASNGEPFRRTWSMRLAAGGRHVLIYALDPHDENYGGTFVRDLDAGTTVEAVPGSGWPSSSGANPAVEISPMAISANGSFIVCHAFADLDPNDGIDSAWQWNAWLLDRETAGFRLLTRYPSSPDAAWNPTVGGTFDGQSYVSDDGRVARFTASSQGLVGYSSYDDETTYYEVDASTTQIRVLSLDWRMRPLRPHTWYSHVYSSSDDGGTVVMQAIPVFFEGFPFPLTSFVNQLFVRRTARPAGTTTCAGDGSGASCPCGVHGIRGRGCANSWTNRGSVLETRGNASISDDSLTLIAYDTPPALTVLLQSTTAAPGGGVPFEGGVLCVGSPARRIALDVPSYDDFGVVEIFGRGAFQAPRLHEVGGITAPGTRWYQVWTRAVGGAGCLASRISLTNGVRVEWRL